MDAAVRYLARLGRSLATSPVPHKEGALREDVSRAMRAICSYEQTLSREMLRVLGNCGARVYGIADSAHVLEWVPTLCFNVEDVAPSTVTDAMARAGIGIRDGHFYRPRLMRRLGLPEESGAARVSLVHYNSIAEIHRFGNVLPDLTKR